jgi:membrane-associated protease RseP (regulator of RpoE activity)
MLNEPSANNEAPIVETRSPVDDMHTRLRAAVDEVFFVEFENDDLPAPVTTMYTGRLLIDSMAAYDKLDAAFAPLDHYPMLAPEGDRQIVRAVRGRINPPPRSWVPNLVLLVLTIFSLLFVGALSEGADFSSVLDLLRGWPYALGVLLILGTHELGHYFAARYHKVAVTLPYFIPLPVPGSFGTLGAFIQLRQPMRNRRVLLDVGAAGPLIGLIVAIPILLIGLKTSPLLSSSVPLTDLFMLRVSSVSYAVEGNSILYALAKIVVFGHFVPDGMHDVFINQLAWAGWTGLLVTAINLIPVGQLDGGHIAYSLFGERARIVYFPLLVMLGVLSLFYEGWILWIFLLLLLGRVYATPLDSITKLDPRRKIIAFTALVMFILVFMPLPLQIVTIGAR